MTYLTGAQAVIASLRAFNINTIFGIPGNHTLPLYDAIYAEPGMRHVLARHEQGAGFMAEGYARASGNIGVACTITGPGATNITTPIAEAYADSIPLLVISSGLPRERPHYLLGSLHETKDQFASIEALAGWSRAITQVEQIPSALYDAFDYLRRDRPRAAYLEIPYDLLSVEADVELPATSILENSPCLPFPKAEIASAVALLRAAKRPILVAGAGVTAAGANEELARLADLLSAPVLLGAKSHDALPSDFPLALTFTGSDLVPELLELVKRSDATLVVGSKLGAKRTGERALPLPAPLIHIDIDPDAVGFNYPTNVKIVADARLALTDMVQQLVVEDRSVRPMRTREIESARSALRTFTEQYLGEAVTLLDALRASLPRETIVVADMTMLGYACARSFPVYEPRTFIHPFEFCSIGCGLPLALGAKVAQPERSVVALCGDGGFLLNASELATAVQERIDVIVIVFNDSAYTAVQKTQHLLYADRYIATDLRGPDFVMLAQAFGAHGVKANGAAEMQEAVGAALQAGGTTLIEVPLPSWPWYSD